MRVLAKFIETLLKKLFKNYYKKIFTKPLT